MTLPPPCCPHQHPNSGQQDAGLYLTSSQVTQPKAEKNRSQKGAELWTAAAGTGLDLREASPGSRAGRQRSARHGVGLRAALPPPGSQPSTRAGFEARFGQVWSTLWAGLGQGSVAKAGRPWPAVQPHAALSTRPSRPGVLASCWETGGYFCHSPMSRCPRWPLFLLKALQKVWNVFALAKAQR